MGNAWTQTERTARAEHRCELCEEPILPGWRYVDGRGCGDDGWYRWPMHVGCERLLRAGTVESRELRLDYTGPGIAWVTMDVPLRDALVDPDIEGIPGGAYCDAYRGPGDTPVLHVVRGVCAAVDAVAGAYR